MYIGRYLKYPLFLSDFSSIVSFLNRLLKIPQISHFMIIRPDTELFIRLDRQTDARTYITKLLFALTVLRTRVKFCSCMWIT